MTKLEAVLAILEEGRAERFTALQAKRTGKALAVLGLTETEMREAVHAMEYRMTMILNPLAMAVVNAYYRMLGIIAEGKNKEGT